MKQINKAEIVTELDADLVLLEQPNSSDKVNIGLLRSSSFHSDISVLKDEEFGIYRLSSEWALPSMLEGGFTSKVSLLKAVLSAFNSGKLIMQNGVKPKIPQHIQAQRKVEAKANTNKAWAVINKSRYGAILVEERIGKSGYMEATITSSIFEGSVELVKEGGESFHYVTSDSTPFGLQGSYTSIQRLGKQLGNTLRLEARNSAPKSKVNVSG